MTLRPDLAANPKGIVIYVDGQPMRHLGDGRFVPAHTPLHDEVLAKRFEPGGPLCRAS